MGGLGWKTRERNILPLSHLEKKGETRFTTHELSIMRKPEENRDAAASGVALSQRSELIWLR